MARYKKQISIYVKESWLSEIEKFAAWKEEDISSYVQEAISFQLMHDRKAWAKAHPGAIDSLREQIGSLDYNISEEELNGLIQALSDFQANRTAIKIAKTRYIPKDDE